MHNVLPWVTLGSTLWELPLPLNGAWESDGRRVKSRIVGPNVERGAQSAEQTWEQRRETLEHARHTVDGGQLRCLCHSKSPSKVSSKGTCNSSPVRRKH